RSPVTYHLMLLTPRPTRSSLFPYTTLFRSRPYLEHLRPRLLELFPERFGAVDPEGLYRAANKVEPSLIRVEADQVTYNLHIVLRDRKSTRLNSSHDQSSYAVFCLKKRRYRH